MENNLSRRIFKAGRWILFGFLATLICALPVSARGDSSLPAEKAAEYQDHVTRGRQYLDEGQFRDAIAEFNRALLLDPSSEGAKSGIIKANQEIAARSTIPDVTSIEKDRVSFHLTKGTEYYDAEKFDEAIAEWEEALRLDPENRLARSLIDAGKRAKVDLLIEKGHDEFFADNFDEAIDIWEQAQALVPLNRMLGDLLDEARKEQHLRVKARLSADMTQQFYESDEMVAARGAWPEGADADGIKRRDISEKPVRKEYKMFGSKEQIMKELTQPVAFEFECEPLRDVLRFLTTITGINILIDEEVFVRFGLLEDCYGNEVEREEIFITIHVSELPLQSALNGMFRQHGLGFTIERDFIYISTPDILRGSSFEQLETRFYHLKDTARLSLPKFEIKSTRRSGGSSAIDLEAGESMASQLEEIEGEDVMELDSDYESMSVPRLVNILRTFIPTVVDQSKAEEGRSRQQKLKEDEMYGGMETDTDQITLFESSRRLWADSRGREILSAIEYDAHTNILIARNTPSNLDILEVFLDRLDEPPKQVAVEAKFITYSILEAEKLGIDLDIGGEGEGGTLETSAGRISSNATINFGLNSDILDEITSIISATRGGNFTFRFTKDDGDFLSATINALSELKNTRTISAPRVVTLTNKPAAITDFVTSPFRTDLTIRTTTIPVEGSEPIVNQSITQEFTDVSEGVSLSITPQVQADGSIRLFILPQVAQIIGVTEFEVITVTEGEQTINIVTRPTTSIQNLLTNVVVNDGDTIVIGGLISDSTSYQITGIPFLKDIPFIGRAFENETEIIDRRNLLIFITVNILDTHGVSYTRLK